MPVSAKSSRFQIRLQALGFISSISGVFAAVSALPSGRASVTLSGSLPSRHMEKPKVYMSAWVLSMAADSFSRVSSLK